MVRAQLDGIKTKTRRPLKGTALQWLDVHTSFTPEFVALRENGLCPYGYAGDQIVVRETFFAFGRWETRFSAKKGRDEWHFIDMTLECGKAYKYDADGGTPLPCGGRRQSLMTPAWWKRPAIFMPRAAIRITLEIVSVRIERLQDISEKDAVNEGIEVVPSKRLMWRDYSKPIDASGGYGFVGAGAPVFSYRSLWESINGSGSWDANPWAWVVEFKVLKVGAP